ncbi:hypothetical protein ACWGOQ_0000840 [Aquimarina sp. M1]
MNTTIISTNDPERVILPKFRLYFMRGLYFLNFISLALDNWSRIFFPQQQLDTLSGVAISFWAGFSILNLLAIRFPIKMLPILLLQLLYKTAWLIGTYIPARNNNLLNDSLEEFFWVCIAGIFLNLLIIPWMYVFRTFIKEFFRFK